MTAIKWEDAPPEAHRPRRRSGGKYADIVDALRANPGKTARLVSDVSTLQAARNMAGTIERGTRKGFAPAGAFEAYAAPNKKGDEKGPASVWVKYIGEPDAEPGDDLDPDEE
jgi:hypothetical protein